MSQPQQSQTLACKRGRPKSPGMERRILRAAQACFATRGFDGIAMDELARKAGISKTTIYFYFRTKQDLFKAALDNLIAQLPRAFELTSGITGDSIEERLFVVAKRTGRLLSNASFEFVRRALASDISPSLREYIRKTVELPYFQAIEAYLRDQTGPEMFGLEQSTSATSIFIALVAGPEAFRSQWSGSAFGSIEDGHLRCAVQVFISGYRFHPRRGARR